MLNQRSQLPAIAASETAEYRAVTSREFARLFKQWIDRFHGDEGFVTIVQASSYLVVLMQLCRLSARGCNREPSLAETEATYASAIARHFRPLQRAHQKLSARNRTIFREIWSELLECRREAFVDDPYLLPDLYMDIKESCASTPLQSGGRLSKVSGREYLRRTQYFTEDYMANFLALCGWKLVDNAFARTPMLVDPACGAGNTLIAGFAAGVALHAKEGQVTREIADRVFSRIIGYDIDPVVSHIASAALTIEYMRLTGKLPKTPAQVIAGGSSGKFGLFYSGEFSRIKKMLGQSAQIILTNPPFLGKRLMDAELKSFLKNSYPEAKGDLCTAFTLRCSELLRPGDVLALVHQSTFWHLDSLSTARTMLNERAPLRVSVTLGSGAFRHLAGEKASVSLSIFCRSVSEKQNKAVSFDLSRSDITEKKHYLTSIAATFMDNDFQKTIKKKLPASSLGQTFTHQTLQRNAKYDDWAVPMQGTSTGNNRVAVRHSWKVPPDSQDWVSVSKGGGYCRWWGLNRYAVLWGRSGEMIKQFPGHALRNVKLIDKSALVFSDTGTQGLNVRLRRANQVFIASGPGIRVTRGNELAHLAYLNSRIASLVLRKINPKLTIAAGYIKKLPFSEGLSLHTENARLAKICVEVKRDYLAAKLANDDCMLSTIVSELPDNFEDYFTRELRRDLMNELTKLEAEACIERNVQSELRISARMLRTIQEQIGTAVAEHASSSDVIAASELDGLLSKMLSVSCQYRGGIKAKSGVGIDGPLEALSLVLHANPSNIYQNITCRIDAFHETRVLYLEDLMHKLVLHALGFKSNREWRERSMSVRGLRNSLMRHFPVVEGMVASQFKRIGYVDDWIRQRLPEIHSQAFLGVPILSMSGGGIRLVRPA